VTNARILRQIGLPNTAAFPAGLLDEGASVSMDLGGEKDMGLSKVMEVPLRSSNISNIIHLSGIFHGIFRDTLRVMLKLKTTIPPSSSDTF
jgi:hypothetical protein